MSHTESHFLELPDLSERIGDWLDSDNTGIFKNGGLGRIFKRLAEPLFLSDRASISGDVKDFLDGFNKKWARVSFRGSRQQWVGFLPIEKLPITNSIPEVTEKAQSIYQNIASFGTHLAFFNLNIGIKRFLLEKDIKARVAFSREDIPVNESRSSTLADAWYSPDRGDITVLAASECSKPNPSGRFCLPGDGSYNSYRESATHELGHMLDDRLGLSDTDAFKKAYALDLHNFRGKPVPSLSKDGANPAHLLPIWEGGRHEESRAARREVFAELFAKRHGARDISLAINFPETSLVVGKIMNGVEATLSKVPMKNYDFGLEFH